ncbi:glutathione-regulated potassium-efflux system oxidoreductase KefF [Rouxiella silvae]|uniref:Glutathione-regulated potassium-efflux system ancillary protein KefF n=1 Tax=Rouxiella silvae TaxID=1646373 RepID=A0AA41BYE1_9GAMM|nr:glutathione-regulated potassium-efflux system oxidoreductase KefF [Rouxiella silvae]MBF6639072.1 glutathione-regulated potassium-efflux system oxidoreductase KefF [Rouxiella silvae]
MILIIYAHPYPRHSHANQRLLQGIKDLPDVKIRSLYDLYPDFSIDIKAEQKAVEEADLVVFQHPLQWYGLPPMLKLWIDKVLEHGWAYGHGGEALRGKGFLWAVTTGGNEQHFELGSHPDFATLAQPVEATALYCGMKWQPYFTLHNTFTCDEVSLNAGAKAYRQRLIDWQIAHPTVLVDEQTAEGEVNG